jgi:hypothetical protein
MSTIQLNTAAAVILIATPPFVFTRSSAFITTYYYDNFLYNSELLNYNDASSACAYYGATLMNIKNQEDLSYALSINKNNNSFWVRLANVLTMVDYIFSF